MAHSSHRRWRGCPLCKDHKFKDHGRAVREPWPVLRKLGTKRRVKRNQIPADQ